MNRIITLSLSLLLLGACVKENLESGSKVNTPAKIVGSIEEAEPSTLLVKVKDADSILEVEGAEVKALFKHSDSTLDRWFIVRFADDVNLASKAEEIAAMDGVAVIEYSHRIDPIVAQRMEAPQSRPEATRSTDYPFNDPELPYQWHYNNDGCLGGEQYEECVPGADINLFNAWKYTAGDNRVIVAVIDGGIMTNHPDLADNLWVNEAEKSGTPGVDDDNNGYIDDIHGYNFFRDNGTITADEHGTHVAGTISAVNNNNYAVSGIAGGTGNGDGVRLMSLQIFENNESCYSRDIARAFQYAADNGAILTNNSWAYKSGAYSGDSEYKLYDGVLQDAIDYFEKNAKLEGVMDGGLSIFAAGNEGSDVPGYPSAYYKNISVSAMSPDYTAACYTNYGYGVNVCAPGGELNYGTMFGISSTSINLTYGYEYMHGTSMASPHVTGCAALAVCYALKQGYSLTSEQLRTLILTSVHDINKYQSGTKYFYDYTIPNYVAIDVTRYAGKLGSGYIDAHLMMMQMDGTPCLYFRTGQELQFSLDAYFGEDSESLKYTDVEVSNEVMDALGMTKPEVVNGLIKIKCTKPGSGRIRVKAIVGGNTVGGGSSIGGMTVEREFEVVVRGAVAANGGWL